MYIFSKLINLWFILIIIIFFPNVKAFSVFQPNQLPFIEYLPINEDVIKKENINTALNLQESRFYILHSYKKMKIKNKIECDEIIIENYIDNINYLIIELKKYDPSFFKNINFNYLVLCQNLKINNNLTAGVPSNNVSTLIFDISLSQDVLARALHHEIFHMIKQDKNYEEFNYKYNKINDKEFEYNGCPLCSESIDITFKNNIDGFVTEYSKNTIEEDQAEVFAGIMSIKNFDLFYLNNKKVLLKKRLIFDFFNNLNKE